MYLLDYIVFYKSEVLSTVKYVTSIYKLIFIYGDLTIKPIYWIKMLALSQTYLPLLEQVWSILDVPMMGLFN